MAFEVHTVSVNVGARNNEVYPIFKVPADSVGGGITFLEGECIQAGAGTQNINLVDAGTGGTSASGTVATMGSTVFADGVPQAFTASTVFVDGGNYVAFEELNVGATNAVTIVSFKYVMGK